MDWRGGLTTHAYVRDPLTWKDPLGLEGCYAEIHHYPGSASNPYGHYSVKVTNGETSLHTHQVITTSDLSHTTIVKDPTRTPDKIVRVELPNGEKAIAYQESMLGRELGPYSQRTNSCVDHVAKVLRQGGADVPQGALGQFKYLKGLGF